MCVCVYACMCWLARSIGSMVGRVGSLLDYDCVLVSSLLPFGFGLSLAASLSVSVSLPQSVSLYVSLSSL